jgi:hypothetical protein
MQKIPARRNAALPFLTGRKPPEPHPFTRPDATEEPLGEAPPAPELLARLRAAGRARGSGIRLNPADAPLPGQGDMAQLGDD